MTKNYLEEQCLSIISKIAKNKRYNLSNTEIQYLNCLSEKEQLMLMSINPKIINFLKNQTANHYNLLINYSRLPDGIKINLNQCSLEYVLKLTKRSKSLYDHNFRTLDNDQVHMIGLKKRSRHRFHKIPHLTEALKLFI